LPKGFRSVSKTELPGCEIAFLSTDVHRALSLALKAGAELIASPEEKPWGQTVAYIRDFNGILIEIGSEMMKEENSSGGCHNCDCH
jgi:uncharacterized glyoxalase superfamily protein PhnB